jgi:SP family arabinose:H+ symporter-like MFS transporter
MSVALGGFLMGFDASVISGVVRFIELEFSLSSIELGWAVASLTLTSALAMLFAGPLSDRVGRRPVLQVAAILFLISAIASAFAPSFLFLVLARMLGGFGVGAALIIAPMYIAEIAPAETRGRLVSCNQLNIVIGISVAFFSNYFLLTASTSEGWLSTLIGNEIVWRWMLGVEALPALLYLLLLVFVPESPRWLVLKDDEDQALRVMSDITGEDRARQDMIAIKASLSATQPSVKEAFLTLIGPTLRLAMLIGLAIAVLQQITGINAVFFYAPLIFEQSGIAADAAFLQAVLVGLVNLVFTIIAILTIDKLGRKPLLIFGVGGIALFMFLLAFGFGQPSVDPDLILIGILGFVACFAVSLGPVMWVLFSELFPNSLRGLAISIVGLVNSAVSFLVQLVFPWELAVLGNSLTFFLYGLFALIGLVIVVRVFPETKGRSLEDLQRLFEKGDGALT